MWSGGLRITWGIVSDWYGPVQSPAKLSKGSLGSDQSLRIRTGKEADGNTDTGSGHGCVGEAGGPHRVQLLLESLLWGSGCASRKRQDQSVR